MDETRDHRLSTTDMAAGHEEAEAATDLWSSRPHQPGDGRPCAIAVMESEPEVELMAVDSRREYRARWGVIQTGFVDDPAQAVREADHLAAAVMERLATTLAEERERLEERWSRGDGDTEHLRLALRRYRQFFGLLLRE